MRCGGRHVRHSERVATLPERRPPAGRVRRPAAAGAPPLPRFRRRAARPARRAGNGRPLGLAPPNRAPDECPRAADQPGGAGLVQGRHQRLGDRDGDQVGGGLAHRRPEGQLALDLGPAAAWLGQEARPARVEAVMAPPTVMPPGATRLRTSSSSVPVPTITLAVTAAPVAIGPATAAGRQQRRRVDSSDSRGVTAAVAAAIRTARTGSIARGARNTAPSSRPIVRSWTTHRVADHAARAGARRPPAAPGRRRGIRITSARTVRANWSIRLPPPVPSWPLGAQARAGWVGVGVRVAVPRRS
jgi:hypothetical protein